MLRRVIPWKAMPRPARGMLHLTATLRGLRQAVWRSFVVPEAITLAKLHRVLQTLFEWEDRHLHLFQFGALRFAPHFPRGEEFDGLPPLGDDYRGLTLAQFTLDLGDRFSYTYDMGDEWIVDIVVDAAQEGLRPAWCWCTDGRRAAPPEDCGGPPIYDELVSLLTTGKAEIDGELIPGFAPDFVASRFDLAEINHRLSKLR